MIVLYVHLAGIIPAWLLLCLFRRFRPLPNQSRDDAAMLLLFSAFWPFIFVILVASLTVDLTLYLMGGERPCRRES